VDQRRLLIASAISLLLIFAYQQLVLSRYARRQVSTPRSTPPAESAVESPPAAASDLAADPGAAGFVTVETDVFQVSIAPVGARVVDVRLNAYPRTVGRDGLLGLVEASPILPLTLQLGASASDARLVYRPSRTDVTVHGGETVEVVFAADSGNGTHLEKRYRFAGNRYLFKLAATVSGKAPPPLSLGLILAPLPIDSPTASPRAVALVADSLVEKPVKIRERLAPDHVTTLVTEAPASDVQLGLSRWAGFAEQYFLAVAIPASGALPAVLTGAAGLPIVRMDAPVLGRKAKFAVYAGPKDREILARAGHDLERALNFGKFWFVAIPLLHALRALQRVTGNYGVAIIVLTALIKAATAPLTRTTFRNMREMQKIQPQMTKLRERFKDDQVALQKEVMDLYRRHRVNPLAGCLPMVLQLPIFVGLYTTLSLSIELRHAPFALWINDLSAPDRLVVAGVGLPVLTLLMGASMFLQQWLTPAQADPAQQRMMMFMPVVFTFFFFKMPAGLVLYWLVNNLLTVGQQYLMMRSMK
jgi:YidC/Oxa1 family membrane protein insertase